MFNWLNRLLGNNIPTNPNPSATPKRKHRHNLAAKDRAYRIRIAKRRAKNKMAAESRKINRDQ